MNPLRVARLGTTYDHRMTGGAHRASPATGAQSRRKKQAAMR
jgi:hypothetical protein